MAMDYKRIAEAVADSVHACAEEELDIGFRASLAARLRDAGVDDQRAQFILNIGKVSYLEGYLSCMAGALNPRSEVSRKVREIVADFLPGPVVGKAMLAALPPEVPEDGAGDPR